MSNIIQLKKGLNIPLSGEAALKVKKVVSPDIVAVCPTDFRGLVPKLLVREGDAVLAGTPVLADKKSPDVVFASPVSGTVVEVVRGEKRKLLAVKIKSDGRKVSEKFSPVEDIEKMDAAQIKDILLKGGVWPFIVQRPYGIIANPEIAPKAVFVSAFSTAPLAADADFAFAGEIAYIQAAVIALGRLSEGGVHMSFNADTYAKSPLRNIQGVKTHLFKGAHPAGNVGVQIHHICPIRKGQVAWTVSLAGLAAIGKLLVKGVYDVSRNVAICGPMALTPCYINAPAGLCIDEIQEHYGNMAESIRFISGDALSGRNVGMHGYLGFYDNQITLLREGDDYEMFGWMKPFRFNQYSTSHTYFHWLLEKVCPMRYDLDTNLHGGERAFVVSDVYGKVFPMNLFPVYLAKACLAQDIDKMEKYGIYEVIEEDIALCEYVDPSKINIQAIISDGIDLMLKEMA